MKNNLAFEILCLLFVVWLASFPIRYHTTETITASGMLDLNVAEHTDWRIWEINNLKNY